MFKCEALEEFPLGVSNLLVFEELNFARCWTLKTILESFGNLTKFKILLMFECVVLEEFALGISNTLALEELDLASYQALKMIL